MRHLALPRFWRHYDQLPREIQKLADKYFQLLKQDPSHPSLHFKKIGADKHLWSVRIGAHYRALALEKPGGMVWFWIGSHSDYNSLLSRSAF